MIGGMRDQEQDPDIPNCAIRQELFSMIEPEPVDKE
jgi:hypothetical protein